ncbi:cytochrome P450 [Nocardia cyriacigeorgica]|jgi:cytochrome P450 family 130|uniref:cytochrome P450 n=1 Tax=Nocardia cyriacigeorgica TaxID=135487 RepID=UPI0005641B53|nr:cytochrome P450 [Nocardia cyriacigeorgica]AVH21230.1 cytochrome P450 [Nocardia cyriacigeorgica]MBF6092487.1 cytochrome P450 [Nocardia cyriacigeorgica]MBF6324604.1 cytochrome P450 [Nocardia cyriacigeorgica]MBF6397062.1 cytochrome P450 [Nocardia cyriacigeorgica]MBF6403280.1 cytochrome P450 [Nocardia cyriacigeorgica]
MLANESRVDPLFELRSGPTWREPWAMYAALREHDPVHRVVPAEQPDHDYWVLTRHEHVYAAARDTDTFSSRDGLTVEYGELEQIGLTANPPMVMQDPPQHTEFRKLVARGFTPRQVADVEPVVRGFVRERLDRLAEQGGGDIVKDLFKPLPSMVVAYYLGVPEQDRDRFDGWTDAVVAASTERTAAAQQASMEMLGYFAELIKRRRTDPGDDTVSLLVQAGMAADDADVDGLVQILAYTWTMVAGGNDTTTGLLGGAVQLLQQHPEQRAALAEDPDRIKLAVEEFARLTSPVQGLARTATRDVELAGVTIPAGRKVLLVYGSANRDEQAFGADAAELDIDRNPQRIMTFGHGPHHCLGAAAARMQARVALEELLARFPDYRVDIDAVEYASGPYVRRPTTVPFRCAG